VVYLVFENFLHFHHYILPLFLRQKTVREYINFLLFRMLPSVWADGFGVLYEYLITDYYI
jgi:hypothetical protein